MYETLIHTFSVIKSKFWSLCYTSIVIQNSANFLVKLLN